MALLHGVCPLRASPRSNTRTAWRHGSGTRCLGATQAPGPAEEPEGAAPKQRTVGSALSRSLTEVTKGAKRLGTNLLLTGESEDAWRRLDQKVNKYPIQRSFTAIGTGGQSFKAAMVAVVESVVGPVHCECISERHSSQKSYLSVTIGPVWVENGDQIIAIYAKMKEDKRAKWII